MSAAFSRGVGLGRRNGLIVHGTRITSRITAIVATRRDQPRQPHDPGVELLDPAIYRQRNLVERLFNKLRHFRKLATRYEKSARNCLAAVLMACTRLWTRHYESAS